MQWPKVSVLVPAFNEEKYILHTLHALIEQDYPDFEIIIADNASTDQTAMVVNTFIETNNSARKDIKLLHEYMRGTNHARECARLAATGSVIAQIDADCIPGKDWLKKGVTQLLKKQRVAVTGPYYYYDGNFGMRHFSVLSQQLLYPVVNLLTQAMGRAAILIGGNAFIRAGILEKAGGYNTSLIFYGDDIDMATRLSKFGQVGYISTLVQQTSARRYKANGFWKVNRKYQECFWNLVRRGNIQSPAIETSHPR